MNKIVGYVDIKSDAQSCQGAENYKDFVGQTLRVLEFSSHDGGVLVLNPQGTALAMFDKKDIKRSFECGYVSGVITPPNLDPISEMLYVTRAQTRKGGYNMLLSKMVIQASLMKGIFTDTFLWAKQ